MKIGIIGAMDIEVNGISEQIDNAKTESISGIDFIYGKMHGKDVVVAMCGEGKVNSAITAQAMIMMYNPDYIINIGVAGGLHEEMKVLDIAIATAVCQHDFDITPLGYPLGYIPTVDCVNIKCDEKLSGIIYDNAKKAEGSNVFCGVISSGDQFVSSNEKRKYIRDNFNSVSTEMEGASIGYVCKRNNTPFSVLRVMSDTADGNADMSFDEFKVRAADISIRIILDTIKNM